ncbi:unnamed protein product [Cuscuta europaea]|uniref:Uncharacterized protein n=1 Tax=Cuscuta europaea TaxID=41803 RepID=A0A9P0ZK28_CUSEU|nr:unnamed protein product [Cuscuta europaea]
MESTKIYKNRNILCVKDELSNCPISSHFYYKTYTTSHLNKKSIHITYDYMSNYYYLQEGTGPGPFGAAFPAGELASLCCIPVVLYRVLRSSGKAFCYFRPLVTNF